MKSTLAPKQVAALAVATKVLTDVQIISFFLTFKDKRATCRADVAELNVRAYFDFT